LEKDKIKTKASLFESRTPGLYKTEAEYSGIVYLAPKLYFGKSASGNPKDDHKAMKGISDTTNRELAVFETFKRRLFEIEESEEEEKARIKREDEELKGEALDNKKKERKDRVGDPFKAENRGIRIIDGKPVVYSQIKKGLTNKYYKRGLFKMDEPEMDLVYTYPLMLGDENTVTMCDENGFSFEYEPIFTEE